MVIITLLEDLGISVVMMLKVRLKVRNVSVAKIVNCLSKFGHSFKFQYKVWCENDTLYSEFSVQNVSALNELKRRLGHLKSIEFNFIEVEQVLEVE